MQQRRLKSSKTHMGDNLDVNIVNGFQLAFHGWCYQAVIEGYREMVKDVVAGFSELDEEDISRSINGETSMNGCIELMSSFRFTIMGNLKYIS